MFYTPEDDYAGSDTITVDAEDENGGVATQKTVAIAVTPSLHGLELLLPLTADVNDTSGKANNLTNNGVTFAASGVTGFGNCGVFAGGTDAARADDADLSFGDEDFTIGAFVLHTATGDHDAIMSKGIAGSSTDYEYTLRIGSDDKLAFEVSNGSADATKFHSTAVAAATWSFVAGVHDSVNNLIKTRLNGVTQTGAYSSGCADGAYLLSVGSRAGAFPLDGRMMYVFVFRRALSEAELDSLYNGGAFRKLVP
jgi:hypothetical protein